jgi:DNA-binding NtrC family response regulator
MIKGRILVVDDEETIRTSLTDLLQEKGYEVIAVSNGQDALEQIECEDLDLALVDLKMPGIDGFEVLQRAVAMKPGLPVLMITGYATVDSAVMAMKLGAIDYIAKPFSPGELNIRIEKALEKGRLVDENVYLREALHERYAFGNIIGTSAAMHDIFMLIKKVAPTDSTILIQGESGTGKELIARAIHQHSVRKNKKFIAVDCGALPETLLESELFGHVKGSFTGAVMTKRGLLEVAHEGTFFLDEVGDLTTGIQAKLLRVLQEKEFRPVGGVKNIRVDVRLIAATNKDLEKMISTGEFREDLYYRLNIVPIHLPPLRQRKEDIPMLVDHFIRVYNEKRNKHVKGISSEALNMLVDFEWPGNIRELENIVERMVIMNEDSVIEKKHIPAHISGSAVYLNVTTPQTSGELKQLKKQMREKAVENIERAFVIDALKRNEWNVSQAARDVGMKRQNFQALMRKYRVKP